MSNTSLGMGAMCNQCCGEHHSHRTRWSVADDSESPIFAEDGDVALD